MSVLSESCSNFRRQLCRNLVDCVDHDHLLLGIQIETARMIWLLRYSGPAQESRQPRASKFQNHLVFATQDPLVRRNSLPLRTIFMLGGPPITYLDQSPGCRCGHTEDAELRSQSLALTRSALPENTEISQLQSLNCTIYYILRVPLCLFHIMWRVTAAPTLKNIASSLIAS